MSVRIQSGQPAVDLAPSSSSSAASANPKAGAAPGGPNQASAAYSDLSAPGGAQDSASIGAVPEQLSGDLPIRQDRVDALRAQIEAGTYKVNAHAVANAMFQDLFRS
jgi:flagellar biosynthesis anti-sigma factor FlgM